MLAWHMCELSLPVNATVHGTAPLPMQGPQVSAEKERAGEKGFQSTSHVIGEAWKMPRIFDRILSDSAVANRLC